MNFYQDKQIRHFCIFLLFFTIFLFFCGVTMNVIQTKAVKNLFISHNNAVVTALLKQGIQKETIAQAITNTQSTKEGSDFLVMIGVTEDTELRFLPFVAKFQQITGYSMLLVGVFLVQLLFGGTFLFFWKREKLYQQAAQVIARYSEEDFTYHMPQMKEGTIYHLFASIEQLSAKLQSKSETEHKMKIFLKNTISDISHQLKTPLTALFMYHEIITDEPDNIETVKEYSEKIGQALKRMEQLIQAILKITRLDAGSIVFEKECCPISELIGEAIRELITRAANEKKMIFMDSSSDEMVFCDKHWTKEAIGNIVKNSLDHTDCGGEIHISWESTPIMIRIYISDNGAGIEPEDLHHIFKRFYRSRKSLDTQGVGLGLSLVKSIIEGQGGNISVQSSLHKGTVFILSFLTEL